MRAACIIFSAYYRLISSTAFSQKSYYFQPKGLSTNIREVRGGEVLGPMGREFMGWRDRVGGWW